MGPVAPAVNAAARYQSVYCLTQYGYQPRMLSGLGQLIRGDRRCRCWGFSLELANRVPSLDSISPRSSEKDDDDEARMTNDEGRPDARITKERSDASFSHSDFVIPSSLDICHSSFLHTRTPGSLSEIMSDSDRTHRFAEGNLPGGLLRPRAQVRQAISFWEGVLLTNCRAFVSDANSRWRFTETPYKYDVCVPDCRKRKTRVANRRDESGRGPL